MPFYTSEKKSIGYNSQKEQGMYFTYHTKER